MMDVVDHVRYGADFADVYDKMVPPVQGLPAVADEVLAALKWGDQLNVVELGVGTGRVARPLSRELGDRVSVPVHYIGVDGSKDMLRKLNDLDSPRTVTNVEADFSVSSQLAEVIGWETADLVLCVGGTFPQVHDAKAQERTMANAARLLRAGGLLIVECHNPPAVRQMIASTGGALTIRYPGESNALVWFTSVDERTGIWDVEEIWVEGGKATWLRETSLLTDLAVLKSYASEERLALESVGGAFGTRTPFTSESMMYTAVFRKT